MFELFEKLTLALYGNPALAIGASFLWGILSILLSPCHLASIPLVIAFINEQNDISTRKAFFISFNFSIGILITLLIAVVISSFAGLLLGSFDLILKIVVSLVLLLVGLYFLGVVPLPDFGSGKDRRIKNRPYLSGLVLGLIFGLALGPCALAFMAPILGIVIANISTQFWFCMGLVLAFITGHCGVLILAGTFTEMVKKYLVWNTASRGTKVIRIICGILIIIAALDTFWNAIN
ncbi:MAG: cytochrome C biogenesis protein [Candidatus Cloacimonetes bacterium]|nr:cytochrome C biogenesis protein [Candidatus Cloacimonadota bacterium]MCF7814657.1 cytochrome C biogenesis protein [Candidatus Cloacimonadota bacterium]MCF7869411.1 cytochrome C biogenesis protein [Candidatus Cloacimonadota bacterium]MCF7884557.1 cytochrome C biogenesis protein [Candidatus Cloacimonadota bacterium]